MKKVFIYLTSLILCLSQTTEIKAQVNVGDSLALVDMYNTMNGPNWYVKDNWLQAPVSLWYGVYVENNRVVQLYFNFDNNIVGSFPASLGNLAQLRTFIFQGNKISGAIPSSFSQLTKMSELIITDCQLSGSIPSFFGNYQSLTGLDLRNNQLTGFIPSSLGKIANINYIQVDGNQLTGKIPASITNLAKLQILSAANNKLTGAVPPFKSAVMSNLWLDHNQLSGPLPDFHLSLHMDELSLSYNQFSGTIPEWMSSLNNASIIGLNNNNLTGSIPSSFGNVLAYAIDVSNNHLSGNVPSTLINRPTNSILKIENNNFTFNGIDSIVAMNPLFTFTYAPQSSIPLSYTSGGTYGKLSVQAGGFSNHIYKWYRNNSLYRTITNAPYFYPDSSGSYFVKVSDDMYATQLILNSDTITIQEPCVIAPSNPSTSNVQSTSATVSWRYANGATEYQVNYKPAGGSFSTINTATTSVTLTGLLPNTKYTWKVRARCSLTFSSFTPNVVFRTANTLTASQNTELLIKQTPGLVFPNPATSYVNVSFNSLKQDEYSVRIYDIQGKVLLLKEGACIAGNNTVRLNIGSLAMGMYLVKLTCDNQTYVSKLIKQ